MHRLACHCTLGADIILHLPATRKAENTSASVFVVANPALSNLLFPLTVHSMNATFSTDAGAKDSYCGNLRFFNHGR